MIKTKRVKILDYEIYIALALILCGALLRVLYIGSCPAGLNQDEASAGYEAWSLLHYGIDRNGVSWPVLFISWGSGQNVLYSYLLMPIIAALGLNVFSVRLLSAIAGTLTLFIFWRLSRRLRGRSFGLFALAILTFCPWHIMASRWALESNLLPLFLLLGIYFTVLSTGKPWVLTAAAAAFALSLYAYGTAFVFLPVFLILAVIYLGKKKKLRVWPFFVALLVFTVIALPIALCNLINIMGWDEMSLFGMTLPVLTETRQAETMSFSAGHFFDFIKLLVRQTDGNCFNSVSGFMFFPLYYIFAVVGTAFALLSVKKNRTGEFLVVAAIAASIIASFFINVNINRMNMAFLPIVYLTALGMYYLLELTKNKSITACKICCVLCTALILGSTVYAGIVYTTKTQERISDSFFYGLGDAIEYANSLGAQRIYITDSVNMPYIYALFYGEVPPQDFYSTVSYMDDNAGFRIAKSFKGYTFDDPTAEIAVQKKNGCGNREIMAEFGNYAVCR